jgi:hypothetical protein
VNRFIVGGAEAYAKGLQQQFNAELAKLRERLLASTDDAQRQQIEQQIAELTQKHREKSRATKRCLF